MLTTPDKYADPGPNEQRKLSRKVNNNLEDDMLEGQRIEDIEFRSLSKGKISG